jgi:hypothetical protein
MIVFLNRVLEVVNQNNYINNNLNGKKTKMQTNKRKKFYVPPTLHIQRIMLEGDIAVQSPIDRVNLQDWETEGTDVPSNNADIWLNL